MAHLDYGPAKKFLYTCQYLKGQELDIKRREGTVTRGTVIGFGAEGTVWTKIRLWAKIQDNNTGRIMQVDLMTLYRHLPPVRTKKHVENKTQKAIEEETVANE